MIPGWKKKEGSWRKQLLSYAKGSVLETGVETGVNFRYYPMNVYVTATEVSRKLVTEARKEALKYGVNTSMIVSPVEELDFLPRRFDTIISTFSLCSYENPARVLEDFSRWCKPGGTVLLLEYGQSPHGLVKWVQQKIRPLHYRRTGQDISRDIVELVTRSPLQIKRVERKYAGAVYMIWAGIKPGKYQY